MVTPSECDPGSWPRQRSEFARCGAGVLVVGISETQLHPVGLALLAVEADLELGVAVHVSYTDGLNLMWFLLGSTAKRNRSMAPT